VTRGFSKEKKIVDYFVPFKIFKRGALTMKLFVKLGIIFLLTLAKENSQVESLQTEAAKKLSNQARR
jgi:hypothetical protein